MWGWESGGRCVGGNSAMYSLLFSILFLLVGLHMRHRSRMMRQKAESQKDIHLQKAELATSQAMEFAGWLSFVGSILVFLTICK